MNATKTHSASLFLFHGSGIFTVFYLFFYIGNNEIRVEIYFSSLSFQELPELISRNGLIF